MNSTNEIRIGGRVIATHKPEHDSTYGAAGVEARRREAGTMGVVRKVHDSHGVCYVVEHDNGGAAWWEPDELAVVPEHPAVTLLREIEWEGWCSGERCCPVCQEGDETLPPEERSHEPGCRLAAILAGSVGDPVAEEREACAQEVDREIRSASQVVRLSESERSAVVQFLGYAAKHIRERGAK